MRAVVGRVDYAGYWFFQEDQEMHDGYFWNQCTGEVICRYQVVNPGWAVYSLAQAHVFVAGEEVKKKLSAGEQIDLCQFCRVMETFNIAPVVSCCDWFNLEPEESDPVPVVDDSFVDDYPF